MKIWAYQTWALIGARQIILEAFIMRKICLISETEFPCVAYKLAYRTLTKDAMALHMGHKAWDKEHSDNYILRGGHGRKKRFL